MIDLAMIRNWGTTVLMVLFLVLWQRSEWHTGAALEIAAMTVATTSACVASYGASADQMGTAVHALTSMMRAQ